MPTSFVWSPDIASDDGEWLPYATVSASQRFLKEAFEQQIEEQEDAQQGQSVQTSEQQQQSAALQEAGEHGVKTVGSDTKRPLRAGATSEVPSTEVPEVTSKVWERFFQNAQRRQSQHRIDQSQSLSQPRTNRTAADKPALIPLPPPPRSRSELKMELLEAVSLGDAKRSVAGALQSKLPDRNYAVILRHVLCLRAVLTVFSPRRTTATTTKKGAQMVVHGVCW